jgi:hypothetical protein
MMMMVTIITELSQPFFAWWYPAMPRHVAQTWGNHAHKILMGYILEI